VVRGQPGQIVHKIPSPKITGAKWTGGVAQVVESLLSKCKALSSNPSPETERERERERGRERKREREGKSKEAGEGR
jgi:hypothetical protein